MAVGQGGGARRGAALALAVLVATAAEIQPATGCRVTAADGSQYDLRPERRQFYCPDAEAGEGAIIYFSLCEPLSSLSNIVETCGSKHDRVTSVATINLNGCLAWAKGESIGKWTPVDDGIVGQFEFAPGDDACPAKRSTEFRLTCARNEPLGSATIPVARAEFEPCKMIIHLQTAEVCSPVATEPPSAAGGIVRPDPTDQGTDEFGAAGAKEGLGAFSVLLVILFLSFSIYCCLGIAQNVRNEGRHGIDAIPHREFWFAIPKVARQFCTLVVDQIKSLFSSSEGSGYKSWGSTIPSDSASAAPQHHPDNPDSRTAGATMAAPGNYSVI